MHLTQDEHSNIQYHLDAVRRILDAAGKREQAKGSVRCSADCSCRSDQHRPGHGVESNPSAIPTSPDVEY